jgi:hypothetical protein
MIEKVLSLVGKEREKIGGSWCFGRHEPNEPAHVHIDRDNSTAKF